MMPTEHWLKHHGIHSHLREKNLVQGRLEIPSVAKEPMLTVLDPARDQVIGLCPNSGPAEVDAAVRSAKAAAPLWAGLPALERGRTLAQCAERIQENIEELALLLALETGKALATECRPEVDSAVAFIHYFAGLAGELKGYTSPSEPGELAMTIREPVGVVGALLSWNVPLLLLAVKAGAALAAGNSVVVKSSPHAPFAVLQGAHLMSQVLPPGVLNLIAGDGHTGMELVRHPDVDVISFTGSCQVGKLVHQTAAQQLKPVVLELGGNCPMLVLPDTPIDLAVNGAMAAMRFTRMGQSCTATSRILVPSAMEQSFVAKLKDRLDSLIIGDPLDEHTQAGSLISQAQRNLLSGAIENAAKLPGVKVVRGGQMPQHPELARGFFFQPALVTGLPQDHPLIQEEWFGPVATITPWDDLDELVDLANGTGYGLAASIWTCQLDKPMILAQRLRAGSVHINQHPPLRPGLSFGGLGRSGIGREASAEAMVEHFTHCKTLSFRFGPH